MKHYLSIFTMFKNEKIYLKEWIDFHFLVGFDHIYMYDNGSTDNPLQVLQKYIDEKKITYIPWNIYPPYFSARENFFEKFFEECTWAAFIDIDEFIFCVDENIKIKEKIKEYEDYSGISVNWICYGDSEEEKYSNDLVIERFVKRSTDDNKINLHVKPIAKLKNIKSCTNPHFFEYKNDEFSVNEKKEKIQGPYSEYFSCDIFRINHYHTKSKEEFFNLKMNKNEFGRDKPSLEYYKSYNLEANKIEDKILHRYLEKLKNVD